MISEYIIRVATRPGLPGTSRNRAHLSRVPGEPVPGRQMSRNPPLEKMMTVPNSNLHRAWLFVDCNIDFQVTRSSRVE